ncbi:GDSL esterase/lipase At4g26790-like [Tasmannia lanceolata]|uniref:GDSL esterase/lipase At4g26790-like n=1 Tax=Tasmannia lanceolata TaxID=3420 RepID=UPI004063EA05
MANKVLPWLMSTQMLFLAVMINAKVPALIVFGDSSVDAGNNNYINTIAKSNFKPYGRDLEDGRPTGRFSNGRLATDFISEAFGIKSLVPAYLDPKYSIKDFSTGVCFASAGSGFDNATSDVLSVIPMWKELEYYKEYQRKLRNYLGETMANTMLSEALHMISAGTNDFLENYYVFSGRSSEFTIDEYMIFLTGIARGFVEEIYLLGGRRITLGGLPPMGCLPLERATNFMSTSACNDDYNKVAMDFNGRLKALADELTAKLNGSRVVYLDVYDKLVEINEKPSIYGFENVEVGCCGTGLFEMAYLCNRRNPLTCKDASKYVYWDAFHPTERMGYILADNLMKTSLAQFV